MIKDFMRVSNKGLLTEIITMFPEAAEQVKTWLGIAEQADWKTPHDIKAHYAQAKVIGGKNVIFKIKGNAYRLWVKVNYVTGVILVKKFGTHKEYDDWEIK
jgi:mRNA interferase HigB